MSQTLQKKWGSRRVKAVNFSATTKPLMISDLKRQMEDGSLTILRDAELARELNKTRLLPGGKVVQTGEVRRTHYDRFWSLAMAASLIASKTSSVYKHRGIRVLDMSDDDGLEMAR